MQTQDIDYRNEAVNLRGYLAFDEKAAGRRPGVLVFHEDLGLGDFAMARARKVAELGYVALRTFPYRCLRLPVRLPHSCR